LLLHCELVCARAGATLQLPFVNLGLCPEAASSLLLPRLIGYPRAAELLLLGEPFSAEQALEWGLINAIGLNAAVFNGSRALGPAAAGLLIGAAGTALCFLLNGISYIAVIAGLMLMTPDDRVHQPMRPYHAVHDVLEGLRAVRDAPAVMATILLVSVISIFGVNFNVLVPVFARDDLHQEAEGFGFLMSSFGAGALIGAFTLTLLGKRGPRPEYLLGSGMGLAVVLVLLGIQHSLLATSLLLAAAGWCGLHPRPVELRLTGMGLGC